jgi:hypothetical protein
MIACNPSLCSVVFGCALVVSFTAAGLHKAPTNCTVGLIHDCFYTSVYALKQRLDGSTSMYGVCSRFTNSNQTRSLHAHLPCCKTDGSGAADVKVDVSS